MIGATPGQVHKSPIGKGSRSLGLTSSIQTFSLGNNFTSCKTRFELIFSLDTAVPHITATSSSAGALPELRRAGREPCGNCKTTPQRHRSTYVVSTSLIIDLVAHQPRRSKAAQPALRGLNYDTGFLTD